VSLQVKIVPADHRLFFQPPSTDSVGQHLLNHDVYSIVIVLLRCVIPHEEERVHHHVLPGLVKLQVSSSGKVHFRTTGVIGVMQLPVRNLCQDRDASLVAHRWARVEVAAVRSTFIRRLNMHRVVAQARSQHPS
jgi:hypothetical protein